MLVLANMDTLYQLKVDEAGQDLIEYSLLLVFLLIAAFFILEATGSSTLPIWAAGSSITANAAASAS